MTSEHEQTKESVVTTLEGRSEREKEPLFKSSSYQEDELLKHKIGELNRAKYIFWITLSFVAAFFTAFMYMILCKLDMVILVLHKTPFAILLFTMLGILPVILILALICRTLPQQVNAKKEKEEDREERKEITVCLNLLKEMTRTLKELVTSLKSS